MEWQALFYLDMEVAMNDDKKLAHEAKTNEKDVFKIFIKNRLFWFFTLILISIPAEILRELISGWFVKLITSLFS